MHDRPLSLPYYEDDKKTGFVKCVGLTPLFSGYIKDLPDTSTLEEIQYHLYVRQKIQRGIKDVEEGRVYTQEEVEKRMEK